MTATADDRLDLETLGVRRPAGVKEDDGVEFPAEAPAQALSSWRKRETTGDAEGAVLSANGRTAVPRCRDSPWGRRAG